MSITDHEATLARLTEQGYVVIEGVLPRSQLEDLRDAIDVRFAEEREAPFVPDDRSTSAAQDAEIEAFLADNYSVSEVELGRLMQRIRHTCAENHGIPWPVPPREVNKTFLHLPTLFDQDRSQRIWNLLNKEAWCAGLVEHPEVLALVRSILGQDCVLSDCSGTSIGPHTSGGAWHVDVPLGQLSEPLPDFPLTTQNVWMLDDFTSENGATCVVPGSHRTRKKPRWAEDSIEGEIVLTAPAGSVAIWLSNTWHRSGPNRTDQPRRAILSYYCRSWIKPFTDFRSGMTPETMARFSPTVGYLMGFSAAGPVRG